MIRKKKIILNKRHKNSKKFKSIYLVVLQQLTKSQSPAVNGRVLSTDINFQTLKKKK